jgi:hypothetical protein
VPPHSGTQVLYSTQTVLAYALAERFYGAVHYAWCTPHFNADANFRSMGAFTPPSSTPFDLARQFAHDVQRADHHSALIANHRAGLRRGASAKSAAGLITASTESAIASAIDEADFQHFRPVVFVIPLEGVRQLVEDVPVQDKANVLSEEFIIKALPRANFDVIEVTG